jgi:hypothetical protein
MELARRECDGVYRGWHLGYSARTYNRGGGWRMGEGLRFLWTATRGYRLRPWRSDYLRWRLETFTGKHAEEVGVGDFWRFLVGERGQLLRFLRWLAEMRSYAGGGEG